MKFKSDIEVQAGLKDSSGSAGASGQVLSSNGATVSWINSGGGFSNDVQNTVKAGVAINKGQAVYVTSADGTNIIVGLASNTSEATSSKTLGLLNDTVSINGFAEVIQIGKLSGLNTSTATIGDPVWLGTNGNLIYGLANKPYAPAHLVYIGVVTRVNANNGEIFITIQNGFELDELHNVSAQTPSNNNGIFYNTATSLWEAKSISAAGGIIGTGTTNYVPKFTGASTIGNSLIFDNGTNVGVGTTSPTQKLEVFGNIKLADGGQWNIIGALNQSLGIYASPNNLGEGIIFSTDNGTTAEMFIQDGGNVGIGTTSPGAKLEVNGNIKYNGDIFPTTAGRASILNETPTSTNPNIVPSNSSLATGLGGDNGNLALIINSTPAVYVNSSSNVGIGTTSPATNLHVSGDANGILSIGRFENRNVGTAVQSRIQLVAGTATSSIQMFGSGHSTTPRLFRIGGSSDGGDMYLATGGVDRLAITLAGNVGIGTTSPSALLNVVGTADMSGLFETNNAGSAASLIVKNGNGTTSALYSYVRFINNNTNQQDWRIGTYSNNDFTFHNAKAATSPMVITTSGNVGIGTSSPTYKLHVVGDVYTSTGYTASGNSYMNSIGNTSTNNNANLSLTTYGVRTSRNIADSNTVFAITNLNASSTGAIQTWNNSGGELMRVAQNGNVGIGTSNPTSKLYIFGDGTANGLTLDRGGNTTLNISITDTISTFSHTEDSTDAANGHGGFSFLSNAANINSNELFLVSNLSGTKFLINSSGNVGIGTSSPGYSLDVTGSIRATQYVYANDSFVGNNLISTSNTDLLINKTTAYNILLYTNGAEKMRITSAGNVGIGTSSPYSPLQVGSYTGTGGFTYGIVASFVGAFNSVRPTLFIGSTDTTSTQNKGGSLDFGGGSEAGSTPYTFARIKGFKENPGADYSGYLSFSTTPSGSDANTERMRITSLGNVGIGTSSPTVKLEVSSSGVASWFRSTSNVVPVSVFNDTTSVSTIGFKGSTTSTEFVVRVGADGNDFVAYTNNAEKMRITSSGNVGIGTSSPGTQLEILGTDNSGTRNNPYNVLTVTADNPNAPYGGFGGAMLFKNRAYTSGIVNSTRVRSQINNNSVDSFGGSLHFDVTPTAGGSLTEAMMIKYNGNVGIGTTSPTAKLDVTGNVYIRNVNPGGSIPSSTFLKIYGEDNTASTYWAGIESNRQDYADNLDLRFYTTFLTASEKMRITSTGNVGIGTTAPAQKLDVSGNIKASGSVQVGDDSTTASATNVGATRYRSDSNNSYMDMVMQTGASTYAWVNVVQNNW